MNRSSRFLAFLAATLLLAPLGCRRSAPPPPPPIERPAPPPPVLEATPVPSTPVSGSELNAFFPASGVDGHERVFTQEKDGVVLAELSKGGKKLATLSISDTASSPGSLGKYQTSAKRIAGLPAADIGSNATGVFVGNRFQVQVRSNDPSFTAANREAWIQKFQLAELAAYAGRK